MELSKLLHIFFVILLCVCFSVEENHRDEKHVRKSRRKRRGCKCVQRYISEVNKMIDARLKDFKATLVVPSQKEKRHAETQRMRDALLRLSGDVAETKNALRIMTNNLEGMMGDLDKTQKDYSKLTRRVNHIGGALGNLSKYVDNMEERLAYRASAVMDNEIAQQEQGSSVTKKMPTQCQDVFEQGGMRFRGDYYIMIKPAGVTHAFKALCQMVNNSGWTVIQKRQDGSVDFYRGWDDYRRGFGSLEGEFWLGNDNIHYLTTQETTMLRIEMEDWNGNFHYAVYDYFRVDGMKENYRLHIRGYHGNAGDSMTSLYENHNGMPFSTKDRDNDGRYYDSCAKHYQGGWWFNNCFEAHLNGKYYHKGFHKNFFQRDGIQWNTIHMYSSLKAVQMMIKPANHIHDKTEISNTIDTSSSNNSNNISNKISTTTNFSTTTPTSNEVKTPP